MSRSKTHTCILSYRKTQSVRTGYVLNGSRTPAGEETKLNSILENGKALPQISSEIRQINI
jgi:hypothetical protein